MRAVVMDRVGGPEVMKLASVLRPAPGPGEVLIKVAYAGVNPADWKCREGYLKSFMDYSFPFVIGFDLAGVVVDAGADVAGFETGMRVFAQSDVGAGKWGAYAEYAVVSEASVVRMPENLGFAQAAAVPTPALAAWTGLFDEGELQPGQRVLIHGGAGAVGAFAIQFARHAGAEVAVTCGDYNFDYVTTLGAQHTIDYRTQDIKTAVQAWSPSGVDLILDTIGCATLPAGLDMLRPGGTLVSILTLMQDDAGPDHAEAVRRGLRTRVAFSKMPSGRLLGQIADLLARGQVRVPRIASMPMESVAQAHRMVQDGTHRAKLVLQVANDMT
ncbi:NADP-dependent oxidoreductase [Pandoraea terrae]|nr:NADP-dependent oxidoreductase [Pandoraea terrae]